MSDDALPRSTPSAEGVAASGAEAFLDAIDGSVDIALHSLMICRHGRVVAEGWWAPYQPDDVHLLYSISKSFTATALGFAVAEGRLGLSDPAIDHFGELAEAATTLVRAITVGSWPDGDGSPRGHSGAGHAARPRRAGTQLPAAAARGGAGTVFAYNNGATYVLAAILQTSPASR